jgi:NAD(P)-dependent dehydrogenase (short-subunit alcohol dehydrogenase family)
MSSVVGLLGSAGQANYAASKAGLVGFARSVARELGSRSITVQRRRARPVETDMTAALGEKRLAELTAAVPLGRVATPDEIAGVVAFLASPTRRTSPAPSSPSTAVWAWVTEPQCLGRSSAALRQIKEIIHVE